jgi:hypothetical protein
VRKKGPVLYIELDTPMNLIQPRLRKLERKPHGMWLEVFQKVPIDICHLEEEGEIATRLRNLQEGVQPVLVIINTLRKAHTEEDKDAGTPALVYGAWREYFPDACLMFVHHDKKVPVGKGITVNQDQMFSGSQHWADDSTMCFHLQKDRENPGTDADADGKPKKTAITIRMTRSQVADSENFPALQLRLNSDGTNWTHSGPSAYRTFYSELPAGTPRGRRIELVMAEFGIKKSAAYSACKELA